MEIIKGKITWINIVSPKKGDIEYLEKVYHIHPLVLEELGEPSARTKVAKYDGYLFLVMHFPIWDLRKQTSMPYELDVILKKDLIVTIHYLKNKIVEKEIIEKVKRKKLIDRGTVETFYAIVEDFLELAMRQIRHIGRKIDEVEEKIFRQTEEEKTVIQISYIKRDILDFRRIFRWLRMILNSLCEEGPKIFGQNYKIYFDDLSGDSLKVENTIDNFADTMESLEITNNSLVQTRIDKLSKIFTIVSIITWPTLIIISVYQMNVALPLTEGPFAFLKVCGISILPSILIYIYLHFKKYL